MGILGVSDTCLRINPSMVQYVDGGGLDAPGEVCCGIEAVLVVVNVAVVGAVG